MGVLASIGRGGEISGERDLRPPFQARFARTAETAPRTCVRFVVVRGRTELARLSAIEGCVCSGGVAANTREVAVVSREGGNAKGRMAPCFANRRAAGGVRAGGVEAHARSATSHYERLCAALAGIKVALHTARARAKLHKPFAVDSRERRAYASGKGSDVLISHPYKSIGACCERSHIVQPRSPHS